MTHVGGGDPQAAEKVVRDYLTAFVGADYERLEALVSEDFVISWRFHESGSVEPGVTRRLVGREAFMDYARTGTSTVRYWYDNPVLRPTADGSSVYVETGATLMLPKDASLEPELEYHNELVFRFDVQDGVLTQQIFWHNPVAALVFHRERRLPSDDEIAALGLPGTYKGRGATPTPNKGETAAARLTSRASEVELPS